MTAVIGRVIPFFGLIFVGFALARITRQPIEALGWMTTFARIGGYLDHHGAVGRHGDRVILCDQDGNVTA